MYRHIVYLIIRPYWFWFTGKNTILLHLCYITDTFISNPTSPSTSNAAATVHFCFYQREKHFSEFRSRITTPILFENQNLADGPKFENSFRQSIPSILPDNSKFLLQMRRRNPPETESLTILK